MRFPSHATSHESGSAIRSRLHRRARNALSRIRQDAQYTLGLLGALRVDPPCNPWVEVRPEGRTRYLPPFLAGTQSGLLYVHEGRAWRLFGGSVYGVASAAGSREWYVFQRIPRSFGRLLRVDLQDGETRSLARFLSTGVHQVDVVNGRLAVVDTYNNAIMCYDGHGKRLQMIHPCGSLENGRVSSNYRHFNSVFAAEEAIYVVAHNQSAKTGKDSEILVLDSQWRPMRVIPTESGSAHNVAVIDGRLWHCDSRGGSLVVDGEPVYREPGLFTRGLAVNRDNVLVGGSETADRGDRGSTEGQVIMLNRSFEYLGRIRFPGGGGVQELRFLEGDLAMSGSRR